MKRFLTSIMPTSINSNNSWFNFVHIKNVINETAAPPWLVWVATSLGCQHMLALVRWVTVSQTSWLWDKPPPTDDTGLSSWPLADPWESPLPLFNLGSWPQPWYSHRWGNISMDSPSCSSVSEVYLRTFLHLKAWIALFRATVTWLMDSLPGKPAEPYVLVAMTL